MIKVINVGTREVVVRGIVDGGLRVDREIVVPAGAALRFERVTVPADLVVKREGARVEVAAA